MITQLKQQEIDLWEVWIEYDQFDSNNFGTLYIFGEIMLDSRSTEPFIVKSYQKNSSELILQVPARPIGRGRVKEVLFSEPVKSLEQYRCISIYAGEELIAFLDEIEVLI